jgi:hypothetical protein
MHLYDYKGHLPTLTGMEGKKDKTVAVLLLLLRIVAHSAVQNIITDTTQETATCMAAAFQ